MLEDKKIKEMFYKIEKEHTGITFEDVLIRDNVAEVYIKMGNIEDYSMSEIRDLFNSLNDLTLTQPIIDDIRIISIFKGTGINQWVLQLLFLINQEGH